MTDDDMRARAIEAGARAKHAVVCPCGEPNLGPDAPDVVDATAVVDAVTPILRPNPPIVLMMAEEINSRDDAERAAEAEVRADERERIARKWQQGGWSILTVPFGAGANVIGLGQLVTDWLRAEAGHDLP